MAELRRGPAAGFHTRRDDVTLTGTDGDPFAHSVIEYEVRRRRDVTSLGSRLGYLLAMRQRVVVPNPTPYQPGQTTPSSSGFKDYPAIVVSTVRLEVNNGGKVLLQRMFPRTLNSAVSTSRSSDASATSSTSHESTSGSSTSNVNTFGVAVTGGFFGAAPVGSLAVDYSHTWDGVMSAGTTDARSSATALGGTDADVMSIKDWSCYGVVDAHDGPTWVWGQSYPWDVVLYNQSKTTDGSTIDLPAFVEDRLVSGDLVLPPSQLSLFGVDFSMTAAWLIDFDGPIVEDEAVTLTHAVTCFNASHALVAGKVSASMDAEEDAVSATYAAKPPLRLSTYSIDVLNGAGAANGTAIGFRATPFTIRPSSPSGAFKVVSPANTLEVSGSGFDEAMSTTLAKPAKLNFAFKVADYDIEYALHLMHWLGKPSGACKLAWTVNGTWTGVVYVDSAEGEGGQGNTTTIELRNLDFTSTSYHDYLVVGTNDVSIEVSAADPTGPTLYTLFAAAVGSP